MRSGKDVILTILLWILSTAFVFELAFQGSRPLVSLQLTAMGSSPGTIGTLLSVAGLLPLVVGIPLGGLADRVGPRRVLMIGGLLSAAGFVGLAVAATPLAAAAAQSLCLSGITATMVSEQTLVAGVGHPRDREQNFGWFGTSVAMGQLVGPSVGGVLADFFSIRLVFWIAALLCIAPLFMLRLMPAPATPQPATRSGSDAPAGNAWFGGLHLLANREVRMVLVVALAVMIAFDVRSSFLSVYLASLGRTKSEIGLLFSLIAVAALTVRTSLGRLCQRFGNWRLLALGMGIAVPALLAMSLTHSFFGLAIAMIGFGWSFGLTQPLTLSITSLVVPEQERGRALGIRATAQRTGTMVSPAILGGAAAAAGLPAVFFVSAAFAVVGCIFSIGGFRTAKLASARTQIHSA